MKHVTIKLLRVLFAMFFWIKATIFEITEFVQNIRFRTLKKISWKGLKRCYFKNKGIKSLTTNSDFLIPTSLQPIVLDL